MHAKRRRRNQPAGDHQALAYLDQIIVADAVRCNQPFDRQIVGLSNLPEGLAFLHDNRGFSRYGAGSRSRERCR